MSSETPTTRIVHFDDYSVKGELFLRTKGKVQGSFIFEFILISAAAIRNQEDKSARKENSLNSASLL